MFQDVVRFEAVMSDDTRVLPPCVGFEVEFVIVCPFHIIYVTGSVLQHTCVLVLLQDRDLHLNSLSPAHSVPSANLSYCYVGFERRVGN